MNAKPQALDQQYKKQITQVLFKNADGAIIGSVLNIALVSFVLADAFPTIALFSWFCAGQLLNLARWVLVTQYRNNQEKYPTEIWLRMYRIFAFVSGSLYGILAIFFFSTDSPEYQVLVILLVGGMGAAAVGTHGVDKVTFRAFMLAAVVPLIGRCLYEGTEVHATMTLMLFLLIAIMVKAASQTQSVMLENFQMSESLRYRATHDGLVGLLNREEFKRAFEDRVKLNKTPNPQATSLIFIDLDNFKKLNDTLGHLAGDKALIEISEIIRHCIRKTDIAARFGGDEFMIMLQATSYEESLSVAEKVLARINDYQKQIEFQIEPALGASIGVAYSEAQHIDFTHMLQSADQACYTAKHSGKGRVCMERI